MATLFKPGDSLCPTGLVVIDKTCRRGIIEKEKRKLGFCTWCGIRVYSPKRYWCSTECIDKYWMTQPTDIKRVVKKRDKGICELCSDKNTKKSLWQMDHRVPIIEGGHPFDLANLRTLCVDCHKEETKKLRERLVKK